MIDRPPATPTARIRAYLQQHPKAAGIVLVAGSALVLVAVVAIVIGQLRPDDAALDASTSPNASASSTAASDPESASPSAAASEAAWAGYELADVVTPLFNSIWARVTVDRLNVRAEPGTGATVRGVLETGDLLRVTGDYSDVIDGRSWVPIVSDGVAGWVAVGDEENLFFQPVATPWLIGSVRELQLAASGDRVLAYGWASDLAVPPYEGSGQRPLAYLSTDGAAWNEVTGPRMPVAAAAGGEGGFVIATRPSYIEPYGVQLSTDGETWSDLVVIDLEASSAAWGPAGPIVVGVATDGDGTRAAAAVRVGLDGTTEAVSLPDAELGGLYDLEASDRGYVLFSRGLAVDVIVSADGATWVTEQIPGLGTDLLRDVELVGNQLLVVITSVDTGRTVLHYGRLSTDGVTWSDTTAAPFGRATIDSISAGDGDMLALGWDMDALPPRVWRSPDGRSWTDLGVDANTFGGAIGLEPVWADGQWFAMTDAIYASTDGAAWEVVFEPPVPEMQGPGCPPPDVVTAFDLLFLGSLAADCYGNAELTVTVWSPVVDGLGGCCPQLGVPEWLNTWIPAAFVWPAESAFVGTFGMWPAPDVDGEFATEAWARVTGHFHDPAAQECRHIPQLSVPHRLESQTAVIAACEVRFVVDQIVPVDA